MIEPLRAARAVLIAVSISIVLLYAAFLNLVSGSDGASISFATAIHAQHGSAQNPWLDRLPGAGQLAGIALVRSFDPDDASGCVHLMHASSAIRAEQRGSERERLLRLIWSYVSLGADLDLGCDELGAPVLWDAVLDLDRDRISFLLAIGADPERAVVRTHLHPLGLNLRELIVLMRARHAEHAEALANLDEIERQLWLNDG